MDIDRLPPHDADAEQAVLGSIVIDPECIFDIMPILQPADFYREHNRMVYQAMVNLATADDPKPIDMVTLAGELRRIGADDFLDEGYIVNLINVVPTSINARHYARNVYDHALRRRMIVFGGKVAALAYDEEHGTEDAMAESEQMLFDIRGATAAKAPYRPAKDFARNVLDHVQLASENPGKLTGIPTGWIDFDRLLDGWEKGKLYIFAARPGMGKTSLVLNTAAHAALKENKRVGVWALEMSGDELLMRLASTQTRIDSQRLKKGNLSTEEWTLFYQTMGELSEAPMYIDDTPGITLPQLASKVRQMAMREGLDMIAVDYLQLMGAHGDEKMKVHQIGAITRGLKQLAREIEIPIILNSQLSRAVEARQIKRPMLSDLRDSGNIEEDADVVGLIYRDEYYNPDTTERPNIAEIDFAKNRGGPTGVVDLYWHGKLTAFRNLQRQEINLGRIDGYSNGHPNGHSNGHNGNGHKTVPVSL